MAVATHAGRDAVAALCDGTALELALEVGVALRACGAGQHGQVVLAVAAPRVEASQVADGFVPIGPTFRASAPGALVASYTSERYTLRAGYEPVLVELGSAVRVLHPAAFAEQRFTARLPAGAASRLQFGLLQAGVRSAERARSGAR